MNTKPSRKFDDIIQDGHKAHSLAIEHGLAGRLGAPLLDGLTADLVSLAALVPGAGKAREDSKTATKSQHDALARAARAIRAVRALVGSTSSSTSVRSAYTVGQDVDRRSVGSVRKALQRIVDRIEAKPDEARSVGLSEEDVTSLRAALAAVIAEDEKQERMIAETPKQTRDRNAVARRILGTVQRIAATGMLVFADDPRGLEFEALLGGGSRAHREAEPTSDGAPSDPPAAPPAA